MTISLIAFACVFCGVLAGTFVGLKLPGRYLDEDAKHAINLALGVVLKRRQRLVDDRLG